MTDWLADNMIDRVLDWFAETILAALRQLWGLLSGTIFVSPDVTQLPQVTAFADTSLNIVNASYVLAFLWVAILVLGRDTIQSRSGPGELIPRLIIGLVAANFATPICSTLIEVANALTGALTGQDITAPESMRHLRDTTISSLGSQNGAPVGFLLLLIGLLIAILVAALVVQWIVRLGLLVVAVGIAPIALALHGTAQTEAVAKLWWRTVLGALGTVVMQATALHTTLSIFLDPDANFARLGVPGDPGVAMNLLIVMCMLWGIVKIPGLMRRWVTQSRPSAAGMILRVVLVQQLTHGISRALSSARSPGGRGTGRRRAANEADPPWPVTSGNVRNRPVPRPAGGHAAAPGRPLPRPSGAAPGRIGVAYPTGRAVRPYTRDELAQGVDAYTRAMKARTGTSAHNPRSTP